MTNDIDYTFDAPQTHPREPSDYDDDNFDDDDFGIDYEGKAHAKVMKLLPYVFGVMILLGILVISVDIVTIIR